MRPVWVARGSVALGLAGLAAAPAAIGGGAGPTLKLKGPKRVEGYEEYRLKAVGHADKENEVVKIFFDDGGRCAATAAHEGTGHNNLLVLKRSVDKGDYAVRTPEQAQGVGGKKRYCGYLSKGGTTLRHRAKTVVVTSD